MARYANGKPFTAADYDKELISGFVRVIEKTLFGECKESEIGIDELFYNGEPSDFTSKLSALNFDAYGFVLVMAGECAASALKKPDDAVVRATQYVLEYIISELEKCLGDNTQRKLHVILCAKDDGLPAVFTIGKAVLTPKNLIYDKLTYIDRKITSYPSAMLIALKAIKKRESILGKNVLNRLIHNSAVQNPVTILLYAREIAYHIMTKPRDINMRISAADAAYFAADGEYMKLFMESESTRKNSIGF